MFEDEVAVLLLELISDLLLVKFAELCFHALWGCREDVTVIAQRVSELSESVTVFAEAKLFSHRSPVFLLELERGLIERVDELFNGLGVVLLPERARNVRSEAIQADFDGHERTLLAFIEFGSFLLFEPLGRLARLAAVLTRRLVRRQNLLLAHVEGQIGRFHLLVQCLCRLEVRVQVLHAFFVR